MQAVGGLLEFGLDARLARTDGEGCTDAEAAQVMEVDMSLTGSAQVSSAPMHDMSKFVCDADVYCDTDVHCDTDIFCDPAIPLLCSQVLVLSHNICLAASLMLGGPFTSFFMVCCCYYCCCYIVY